MDIKQLASELRELNDTQDRFEAALDGLLADYNQLREREIPASTASVSHTMAGVQHLQANLAGTVQMLATQLHDMTARLTLLERVIDADLPPLAKAL